MANTKKTTTTTDKLAELGKGKKTVDDYLAERSQRLNGDKASTSSTTGGRGTSTPGKTTTTTDKLAELGKGRKTVNDYLEDYNRRQEKQFAQRNAAAQVNYYGATSAVHGLRNLYDSYSRQAAQEKAGNEQYKNGVMSMYSAVKNLADKAEAEKTVEKTTINPPRPMEHEGTMPIARGNQILGSVSADQVSLPELAGTPITNRGRSAAAVETDAMAKLAEETARMERIREYQGIPQRDDFDYERYQMGYIPPNGDQVLRAMSDEEKAVYRYIRINYGDKEAEEYYQYMKPIVESRRLEAASEGLVKIGEEHPVAASVLSTMFSTTNALIGGAKLLYDAYKNVTDPGYTIDPYDQMNGAAFIRDKLREGTMTNMPEWGKFLYQTGMSIADTSANALLFGGTGGAIALGTGAAADTAREVKMRGGTDDQALGMGVIAGAAELLTEKMGFDRLGDLIGGKKGNVFRAVLGHMTSEFGEEAGTEVANLFADWAVMQDKSQYDELVKEHGVKGAWWEMLKQVGLAGAGGALSGGVMGGGSAALGKAFQSMQNRETRTATQDAIRELAEKAAEAEAVVPQTDVAGLAMQTAENEAQSSVVEAQESAEAQTQAQTQNVPERAAKTATQAQAGAQSTQSAAQDVQKAQYMESAQEAGKKYGDRAALVFAQNYTGGDVKQYDAAFNALYSAGKVGLKLSDIGKVTDALTAGLSEATKQSIWQAGANSRMTEVIPGVQKMYTQKATDTQKRQIAILNEIGRRYGVEIDIVDSIDSGLANGAYSGGRKIVVALDAAEGAIAQTGVHELVHYLKRTDSDSYEVFRDAVMEHLTNSGKFDLEQAIADRGRQYAGRNMTREDLIEEIIAEAAPTFLTDRRAMEEFVNRSPRSLIEKIRDFFLGFVDEIRAIAERYANRAGSERQEIKALLGMSDELTDIARFFDAALETASMETEAEAGETVFARKKPVKGADDVSKWTPAHRFMNEYMTSAERRLFEENLENTPKSKWQRSKDGYYMVEAGRALVYTDFNRINPKIDRIAYFYTNDGTELSGAMGIWRKCEREGVGDEQNRRINDDYCGFGCVLVHYYDDWREIEREEQRGKGTDGSGAGEGSQADGGGREEGSFSLNVTPAQTRLVESDRPVSGATEAKWSLARNEEFMDNARNINAKTGNVDQATMDQAAEDRAQVKAFMETHTEAMNLPADIEGDTFFADGAYGGSEESTSVCVRSMAVQELMDLIGKNLGRPLTVEDTLVISQEVAAYTDKAECYYCYVAQDRRAMREFLGTYLEQRDDVLKRYKAGEDKGKVYTEWLNGRKDTKNMRDRFAMWTKAVDEGGALITPKDLASLEDLNAEITTLQARIAEAIGGKVQFAGLGYKQDGGRAKSFAGVLKTADAALKADINRYIQLADALQYSKSASWAKKQSGYAAYNGHILKWSADKVKGFNDHYGLRMYSFSDFSPAFILENMQMLTDAAAKGLKVLAYTKELDFVRVFAGTGANINISVFATEINGQITADGMMGADWAQAIELREKYPNVGITFVATNDNLAAWAEAQDWIDTVIPYHLVRTGQKVADYFGYKNYTQVSSDKKKPGIKFKKGDVTSIPPEMHGNDIVRYVRALEEHNLTPRFENRMVGYREFLAGEMNEDEFRAANPYYMKYVNETRRSAQETPIVQPKFEVTPAITAMENLIKEGGYGAPIGQSYEVMQEIAEEIADKIRTGVDTLPDQTSFSLNRPIERKGDLVAVHNLDVESLLKVIRINGFAAPSIAVTKTGLTTLKFGSVTIVFDKNVVDPKADARNRLYARDAYTPVVGHAREVYVVNAGTISQLRDQLKQHMDFLPDNLRRSLTKYLDDVSSGNLRFDSAEELVQDAMRRKAMKAAYLVSAAPKLYDLDRENASFEHFSPGKAQEKMDRWIDDTIAKEDGYEDWVKSVMGNVYGGKRVGVGGNSAEPTAENIVKSMYENAREKANTPSRNAHALSYALAQAYDSIKAAKKDMRLLGNDEARYAKLDDADQALEGWIANVEQVNGKSGAYDVLREAAYNGAKTAGDIRKAFAEAGWTIDRAAARTAADIFARINSIATPYFEAKPGYAVGLDSVKAVLIPDNVDTAALEEIRAAFGNVVTYPAGNNDARLDALNGLNGVKFSLNNTSPASTITDENQNLSLPVDVEVDTKAISEHAKKALVAGLDGGLTERMRLQIKGIANKIMNETGSGYSKDDFIGNMTKLIEQYAQSGWTEDTLRAVTEMSRKIIEQSRRADTTLRDQYADLRKRLREAGIAFTETQKQEAANIAGSYGEYRKGLMGSVKLAENGMTLEAMWDELSTEYPELFAPGTNEGDMVQKLQDFTHLMQPRYENPYGMDMDGAALEMAMRIEGDIMGIIGVKDAAKAMYGSAEKLRARFEQEFKEKLRQQKAERVQKFQQIAADLKAAKAAGDSAAQSRAMSQYRAAMKATGLEDAYAEIRATLKARQEAKAETAERNKVIGRISKQASELMGMFTHPKKGKRIPTALQDTVLKVLEALDINGEKAASEGRDTIKAKEFREKLTGIREFYETVVNSQSAGTAPEIMEGLMMTVSERNVEMINEALDVLSKGDRFVLREMNSDQLKSLSELMKNIKHTVESVGKLWRIQRYQGVVELGDASIEEMDKRGPEKLEKISKQGIREGAKGARDFFVLGMMEPVSYGERLGEGGSAIIQGLMDGEKEKFGKVRAASDAMGRMMKDVGISGYDIGKWMQNVQTVKFANGTQVKMTDAMIMSMYLTAQRPQGIRHLLGTGFTIREGERVSSHVDNISLVQDDLNMIAGLLTDKQRRLADAMQAYLSTDVAKWGNDVTQRLYLYDAFTEGKYWPLISDPKQINTEEPEGDRAFMAIVNAGFTKPLNENANNAVIIQDAFKVFERHISEMASYAGYAEVMTDTMAWLNYRQRDENGLTGKDIKGSMAKLLGEGGQKYLTKLIQDINGARRGGDVFDFGGGWLNKLTGKAKAAAVAGKIRVAMQQPTSIVRAAAEINPIYLIRAMKPTWGSVREMQKWSNLAWWKANGNYDIGVGKSMNKILFGDTRVLDTTKEVAGKVAALGLDPGKADDLTWSRIWEAAKLEIKRKRKDLKVGSDEYFRAVTERFEAICDRTQVVDTVMHRSAVMRNKDGMAKNLTAFMGEPIKSYNMLMRSTLDVLRDPKNAKVYGKLVRTGMAYVASVAATTAATALFDALKYRDDDDPLWEYLLNGGLAEDWTQQFLKSFWGNLNPASNIVLIKDIIDMLNGGEAPSVFAFEIFRDISDAVEIVKDYVFGENKKKLTRYGAIKPVANMIGTLSGYPVNGLLANAEMLAHAYDPKLLQTKSDMQTMDAAYDKLYQAMLDGNKKETLAIRTELNKGLYGAVPKNPAEIDTGIAKAMALTDERILKAWKLRREGRTNELTDLYKQIMADGFTDEQVKKAANSVESYMTSEYRGLLEDGKTEEAGALKAKAAKYGMELTEKPEKDMEKELEAKTLDYKSLFAAIRGGDADDIADAVEILIDESDAKTEEGKEKAVRSQVSEEFREEYIDMVRSGKTKDAEKLAEALEIVGFDEEDRTDWVKKSYREDLKQTVTDGDMGEAETLLTDMRENYGMTDDSIADTIRGEFKQQYIDLVVAGKDDEADALAEKLMELGLKYKDGGNRFSQSNLNKWVTDWEKAQEEE